jgi:RNA polymerase sigma-70 factor (ECF subfamily)
VALTFERVERARPDLRELEQQLRPFVARRVPASEVDDVLQDVFVRVQRSLGGLRDEERLVSWLYRVARSAVQESLRQRARHPLASAEYDEPAAVDPESSVACESGLAAYRQALTLTELEGMSQLAAAKQLGISPSGMKSRVQRGREKLREILDASCNIALDVRGRVIACEPKVNASCSCTTPED